MTPDEIRAAVERAEAASKGPWRDSSGRGVGAVSSAAEGCAIYQNIRTVEVPECVERWQRDAAFIAAAREDVPRMAEEIDRLRAERDEARAELKQRDEDERDDVAETNRVIEAYSADVVRLHAALVRYGTHRTNCNATRVGNCDFSRAPDLCDCGLDAALAAAEPKP